MCIKSKSVLVVAGLHCSCTSLIPFKALCTHINPKDALQFHKCVSHMSITSFTPKRCSTDAPVPNDKKSSNNNNSQSSADTNVIP